MEELAAADSNSANHDPPLTPSNSEVRRQQRKGQLRQAKKRQTRRFHRIRTVRRQQGMSLRTAARQLGASISEARLQEEEASDLRLSDLYRWQVALGVPAVELLQEPGAALSHPVMERARMVRVMKTAMAILERPDTPQVRRLAQMLVEQLVELMPELEGIGPWHSVGQRRSLDEFGRIAERHISEDLLSSSPVDLSE